MNDDVPMDVNYAKFEGPEAKFCPAGVYEYVCLQFTLLFVYYIENNPVYFIIYFFIDMYQEKMESMVLDW